MSLICWSSRAPANRMLHDGIVASPLLDHLVDVVAR